MYFNNLRLEQTKLVYITLFIRQPRVDISLSKQLFEEHLPATCFDFKTTAFIPENFLPFYL